MLLLSALILLLGVSASPLQGALIFTTNATWKYFKGYTEASLPDTAEWRQRTYDDSSWASGSAPLYYGEPLVGTLLNDMQGNYSCVFLRRTFVVNNVADVGGLELRAFIDDGFIAWINGFEVARTNVTATDPDITKDTLASTAYSEPLPFTTYRLPDPSTYLMPGTNVIAVQGFNVNLTNSSDFVFYGVLASLAPDLVPPTIVGIKPLPGTVNDLTQITVTFSEPVTGVDTSDFRVNGMEPNSMTGDGDTYTFYFGQLLLGTVYITWAASNGITDFATPANAFDPNAPGHTWQYELVDDIPPTAANIAPYPGLTVGTLTQIEVTFSEAVTGVDAGDLLINDAPATNLVGLSAMQYVFGFPSPATGTVQVAWASGHGITDRATQPNVLITSNWTYVLDPNAPLPDLVINEFLASNVSTNGLADEDGDQEDWIEIYNRGSNAVNLAGWLLSDDADLQAYWAFPPRLIAPDEYLIVFASGKDRKYPTGANRLHTNFKLSGTSEHLGLYAPGLPHALASGFSPKYSEQRNDTSYGYDSAGALRYFATPTPGGPNGQSSIRGVCAPVHFSVERGFYTSPFNVFLTTATPGAAIRYTTDGTEPTLTTGKFYTNALRITNTTLLRAAAFRTNHLSSAVATHTYFFNQNATIRSLPVLSIVTDGKNLWGPTGIMGIGGGNYNGPDASWQPVTTNDYHNPSKHGLAWERPVSAEYILPANNAGFQVDCGIRIQGSDWQRPRTRTTSKFSFRLYFRGDYGTGLLEYPLFEDTPVTDFDQLVLRAGFNEQGNPFIRDEITRRMSHDMGQVSSHGTFVNVFTNGGYAGYYNPCERVHEEFLQSYLGGSDEWDVVGPTFAQSTEGPGVIDGDRADFQSLVSYIRTQPTTNPTAYQTIAQRLDLVNFVDYCLLNSYTAMGDWPQNNWRAGKDRGSGGIWRFIVWDAEWAMGIYDRTVVSNMFTAYGPGPNGGGLSSTNDSEIAQIYQRLVLNPEFRLLWADRIHKHFSAGGALTGANITNRFNRMRTELIGVIPSMDTEILAWARDRLPIIMDQFSTHGLYGYSNSLYGIYASSNAPAFNQPGGRVAPGFDLTMAAPLGGSTIYYTTDGSDPRVMFTGAASPSALAYTNGQPVRLNDTVLVKARALNGANWSALTEATFQVAALGVPLRVTEIMYHPPDGNAYEYFELRNVSSAPVDLSLMYFDPKSISLTFTQGTVLAGGATMVIASDADPAAFGARYTNVVVGARFSGALDNGGEELRLLDRFGQTVLSVTYNDENGWATAPDGSGYSLEINDEFGSPDDPANWRASTAVGGSPGTRPAAPPHGNVRLNEVMATNRLAVANAGTYPDWIELVNAGLNTVDLTGWSLTDDGNPRKFVFPAANIGPGGFLVVWCDSATNTTPGMHAGFMLDSDGESIFLYDAATNRVDALTFGLQLPDYSIGVFTDIWQLSSPTPGASNTAASVGSVSNLVINEWMANPAPGQDDWVELYNRSADLPVALRGVYLGTSNAVFQLTALSFIAPGGFVQLFADERVGPDHLDLKLPAGGGTVVLYDDTAAEINRVTYTNQLEGVSSGRLPDGSITIVDFPGSASPERSNYTVNYAGPYLNEIMARNRSAVTNGAGQVADWIELFNPNATDFNLGGMSLSVDEIEPGQWAFPPNTVIPAFGFLVIWCDSARAASTNAETYLNNGRSLDGESGGAYLFNAAGQLVNSIEYGFQLDDQTIGRVGAQWLLLASSTPDAANSAAATLGAVASLRLNEWMANPARGDDWFEIYNSTNRPVDMGGTYLSDDPSMSGTNKFRVAPLSFIGGNRWVKWVADENAAAGRNHVNFDLDAKGESLLIYAANFALVDVAFFGAQPTGVSEGRLLDGTANIVSFAGSPSPGESNYLLPDNVVVNEVLTHTDPPLEDAIELFNPTAAPALIGGWYLSDNRDALKKYRIPDGTVIPAGGFQVFYEYQFNSGSNAFALSGAYGGNVWLSAADAAGNLSGYRATASFGPAANGVSFGRYATRTGVDFTAMQQQTFGVSNPASPVEFRAGGGAPNADPLVGSVVISEIMYRPPDIVMGTEVMDNTEDEFIEVQNITTVPVALFDTNHPANTWRLRNGVDFIFPENITLPAGGFLLLVNFEPTNEPVMLANFQAQYRVPMSVPIYGPYRGKLDNGGESVDLYKPDSPQPEGAPDAGYVPYVLVDRVEYSDTPPWPSGAVDGGGLSLQRRVGLQYGNDPLNWVAAEPTAGAANNGGIVPPPLVTASPQSQTNLVGTTAMLSVETGNSGSLSYQWRFNGMMIPDETNAALLIEDVQLANAGTYDVFVSNPAGSAFSATAQLVVHAPPVIVAGPQSQSLPGGTNATFTVFATGSAPLSYQWQFNGADIPGATNSALVLTNLQLEQGGTYTVVVSNFLSAVSATATLTVLIKPYFTQQTFPQVQTVAEGSNAMFTVGAYGTLPISYRWRKGGATITNVVLNSFTCTLTMFNARTNVTSTNGPGNNYNCVLTNIAGSFPTPSSNATLVVVPPTVITNHPSSQTVAAGANVTFMVGATGYGVLNYQWLRNGTPLAGQNDVSLTLLNVQSGDDAVFAAAVSNAIGTVTSRSAALVIDSDGDGLPDWWEMANRLSATNAADALADSDGDTMLNWQEFVAGTDPHNNQSYLKVDRVTASGSAIIEFTAVSNRTYTVQYSDVIFGGAWATLTDVSARPTNRTETVTDPYPNLRRFYRLVTPKQVSP